MNIQERVKMVRAMETIARAVNDEELFCAEWLTCGVADGDIDGTETDSELEWYCKDKNFAELMETFLTLMEEAHNSGGLYVDGVGGKTGMTEKGNRKELLRLVRENPDLPIVPMVSSKIFEHEDYGYLSGSLGSVCIDNLTWNKAIIMYIELPE